MSAKSRTAKFYASHPKSRKAKQAYDADFNKKPDQVKKRVELNAYNKKATKAGRNRVGDKTDASHKGGKIVGYASQSANRGDRNNSAGDRRSRSAKGRPGGRKK